MPICGKWQVSVSSSSEHNSGLILFSSYSPSSSSTDFPDSPSKYIQDANTCHSFWYCWLQRWWKGPPTKECGLPSAILWFTRNIYLAIQLNKIYFSYILGLSPQFLTHSSPNSWDCLRDKSNGNTFCYNIWSLVLSSWNHFRVRKVKWVSCYS